MHSSNASKKIYVFFLVAQQKDRYRCKVSYVCLRTQTKETISKCVECVPDDCLSLKECLAQIQNEASVLDNLMRIKLYINRLKTRLYLCYDAQLLFIFLLIKNQRRLFGKKL